MATEVLSKIGIGSGLNNTDIIKAIVDAETVAEKEKIEKDEAEYESKISAFGIVKSELKNFQLVCQALKDVGPATHVGSSSNTNTATFTNTGTTNNDDIKKAELIDKSLQPLHKALFIESNPAPVKYAAKILGLCSDEIRLPLVNIQKKTEEEVNKALSIAKLIN